MYTSESGVIHDPDPGPQEKSMKKSCVSFETECMISYFRSSCAHTFSKSDLKLLKHGYVDALKMLIDYQTEYRP